MGKWYLWIPILGFFAANPSDFSDKIVMKYATYQLFLFIVWLIVIVFVINFKR